MCVVYACLCKYVHNACVFFNGCLPQWFSILSFEIGSFNEPGAHQLASLAGQSSPLVAASPVLVRTWTTTVPSFIWVQELNWAPHICTASTLLTDPSPQPPSFFCCKVTEQLSSGTFVDDSSVTQCQKSEHTRGKRGPRNALGNTYAHLHTREWGLYEKRKQRNRKPEGFQKGYLADGVRTTGKLRLVRADYQEDRATVRSDQQYGEGGVSK